jgi:cellulose synthase/poly-beta-1,6-N-acetylglucosamine synthase-like glycosyltransferase
MSHRTRWIASVAALAASATGASAMAPAVGAAAPRIAPPAISLPATALKPFRIDVSHRAEIGAVVTVPGASRTLTSRDFTVRVGSTSEHPTVRRLSPSDVQLAFSPDVHVPARLLGLERSAGAEFLIGLPAGAQTAVASTGPFTSDPAATMADDLALARGPYQSAAARLTTALSAFSSGATVRRTVVLVLTGREPLRPALSDRLRRQLAASGTALYLLDASRAGNPEYAALAAGSGGFTARVRTGEDWSTALGQITADLDHQYYLRFTDRAPLPNQARITAQTSGAPVSLVASLPRANATAPPLPAPPSPSPAGMMPLAIVALGAVGLVIVYGLTMLAASRREPRRRRIARGHPETGGPPDPDELFFVFLLPCLNEEKVIVNSLQALLSFPGDNYAVMVIDDGSDDDTAAVVSGIADHRVWLLRRTAPNARQGKGEALNAAIGDLRGSAWLEGRDLEKVVVVVVDADGRVDPHSLAAVTPFFADPTVGAVQIGVRINNREMSRLARMQDMEFVIYTEVFQRGRRHLGSVGLGGNGQFMRLSALRSLGEEPWSHSLTEDLDLGIRLLTAGWRNEYCHTASVHQQGVIELRRLVRQRSRWFQGHLQSWKLIPTILRGAPRQARADLLYHVSSPAILLITSLLTASFVCSLVGSGVLAADGGNPLGWWVLTTYLPAFGPALLYSYTYWLRERDRGLSLSRTAGLAHLYVCYSLMWYAAGWWAVGRTLCGRTNWSKTERVAEAALANAAVTAIAPLVFPPAAELAPVVGVSQQAVWRPGPRVSQRLTWVSRCRSMPSSPGGDRGRPPAHPGEPPMRPASEPGALESAPRPHGWRRRARVVVIAAAVGCVAAALLTYSLGRGTRPQKSEWYQVFSGYGHTSVAGSGTHQAITLSVATTHSRRVTHAALMLSRSWYRDLVATAHVRTVRQLRAGSAGSANPWEVGWVVWHYSSPQRFYALTLERHGWLLSKQDPAYPGGERFLASGRLPQFPLGATHQVGIIQVGGQILVSADGHLLAKFDDTQRPYETGAYGMYAEDSVATFSDMRVRSLPKAALSTVQPQTESANR